MANREGSFQTKVTSDQASPDTVVLTENYFRRSLSIKNIGQNLCFVAFGQPGAALDNGWPLQPNEYLKWDYPTSTPQTRVTAKALNGDTILSVITTQNEG